MKRLRLLIDMDSVIVDLCETWFGLFDSSHETKMGSIASDVRDFNFGPLTDRERSDLFSYLDLPGFFQNLPPIAGAIPALRRLSKLHEIIIVSTPPNILSGNTAAYDKAMWLHKHCSFLRPIKNHFVLTSRKDIVMGDLLFDDGPHNLVRIPGRSIVAMDYPYNAHIDVDYRVFNRDWKQFESIVEKLASL